MMKISRNGHHAYHGQSSIEFAAPTFKWDSENARIRILQSKVADFSSDAHHDYAVQMSLTSITSLFEALAEGASNNPALFEKEMAAALKPLLQLQAAIAGITR